MITVDIYVPGHGRFCTTVTPLRLIAVEAMGRKALINAVIDVYEGTEVTPVDVNAMPTCVLVAIYLDTHRSGRDYGRIRSLRHVAGNSGVV